MSPQEKDQTEPNINTLYDCAVLGGGPAGLSAAVYMGRMRRSVIVIDDQEGRSTWHQINRNYLGFPEGIHALSLREVGAEQARRYGARFLNAQADSVSYKGEGSARRFYVSTTSGVITARTLILATGVTDRFPEFEGRDECIGRTVFWCIICDGYESIDKKVVVLGHSDRAAALALQLRVFTDDITLVAWDASLELHPERIEALREHGIVVHDCACEAYHVTSKGCLSSISLADGTEIALDMLFVAQRIVPNTQLAKQLSLDVDDEGYIRTDSEQCTNVDGAYAAGDVTKLNNHQVTSAVHEGGMAAAAANYYLYEDWQKE